MQYNYKNFTHDNQSDSAYHVINPYPKDYSANFLIINRFHGYT